MFLFGNNIHAIWMVCLPCDILMRIESQITNGAPLHRSRCTLLLWYLGVCVKGLVNDVVLLIIFSSYLQLRLY